MFLDTGMPYPTNQYRERLILINNTILIILSLFIWQITTLLSVCIKKL